MTRAKNKKRARRHVEDNVDDEGFPKFSWERLAACFFLVGLVEAGAILDFSPGVLSHPFDNSPLVSFVLGAGNVAAVGMLGVLIHMVFVLITEDQDVHGPTTIVISIPKNSTRRKGSDK